MKFYTSFCENERRASLLQATRSILEWDQQCFMPEEGSDYRSKQISLLSGLAHQEMTSQAYKDAISRAEDECLSLAPSDRRRIHLSKSKRQLERLARLPQELVEALSQASAEGHSTWERAKKQNNFALFSPSLKKITDLLRKKAGYLRGDTKTSLYDQLLSEFEWGLSQKLLDKIFNTLKPELMKILAKTTQNPNKESFGGDIYNEKEQHELGMKLAQTLGFDSKRCVLNQAMHPFSITLGIGDYRITTFYKTDDPFGSFFAIAHEMGHSLYEQGLPKNEFGTRIGEAASYGIHESQSLFWEKRITKSKNFLKQWHPEFKKRFPETPLATMNTDSFIRSALAVKPDLIRIYADEVSYCLHIIIRYEIEKALIDENLAIEDLPSLWNEKYEHYLGVRPPNDAMGCLQDVHWSGAAFGYFPSYALGHLYSAQFTDSLESQIGSIDDLVADLKFDLIRKWLLDNIHTMGASHDPLDLVEKVTGRPLSSDYFIRYLNKKYC